MKLAACDYDGTLFRRGQVSREDLEAITAWREAGHLFGLATGRDFNLTRTEIEHYSIPFDFIICNTGASGYDGNFTPIFQFVLPPMAVNAVLDHPATQKSRYFLLSRANLTYIYNRSAKSWLTGLGMPLEYIGEDRARSMKAVMQIGLEFDEPEIAAEMAVLYNLDLGPALHAQQSGICVDLVTGGLTKAEGIDLYLEFQALTPELVLAFGDSENDLSMFEKYQGYAMSESPDEVKAAAVKVVDSPAQALWANLG